MSGLSGGWRSRASMAQRSAHAIWLRLAPASRNATETLRAVARSIHPSGQRSYRSARSMTADTAPLVQVCPPRISRVSAALSREGCSSFVDDRVRVVRFLTARALEPCRTGASRASSRLWAGSLSWFFAWGVAGLRKVRRPPPTGRQPRAVPFQRGTEGGRRSRITSRVMLVDSSRRKVLHHDGTGLCVYGTRVERGRVAAVCRDAAAGRWR
jgi:hypothetical protein